MRRALARPVAVVMAAAAALALLWLADSVVAFHGSSLCTICFSHMESQYLGLAPSWPFASPGTRPLMTWRHTDTLHRSPAAETLFASDHAHAWQPAGGRWLRYLRTASTSPVCAGKRIPSGFAGPQGAES